MAKKQKLGTAIHVQPKTVRVRVDRMLRHPLYLKAYRSSTSLLADLDEAIRVVPGDRVLIEETRPVSKRKAWRVVNVVTQAQLADTVASTASDDEPSDVKETQ